ncbi:HK97 family phage prohead protease [Anaerosolibacter sp.]|uniref:HK97 family phage prohead protease n=1 Tax=Anaerosolibacter sp. TaxID=1872527 RepID=UPI0039EF7DAC
MAEEKQKVQELNKRTIKFDRPEHNFRAVTEEVDGVKTRKIRGYALLFDVLGSPWLGSVWKEKIDKTALSETKLSNTYGLINHNGTWVLGKAGKNITLTVDKIGLFIEITLGNTWVDDYAFDRVEREIMDGMSFWFDSKTMIATDWENKVDTIVKINEIYEVSLLPFPAYPQAVVVAQEEQRNAGEEDGENNEEPVDIKKLNALLDLEMEG